MTSPLDLARIQALCGMPLPERGGGWHAWHAETVLAAPGGLGLLAGSWLRDEVIARARVWQSEMNGEPTAPPNSNAVRLKRGQIGILLATENSTSFPLLRPAFVLPVEWRRGERSSALLPAGMADFAAAVLYDIGGSDLCLHLAASLEEAGTNLSGLRFSYESAWAALAAGAIVAKQQGATRPDVLVSAAWTNADGRPGWIAGIGQVQDKLDEAAAHGARIVLLPQENAIEAGQWRDRNPDSPLDIRHLSNVPGDPERVLAPVLQALEAEPSRAAGASLEERCGYFTRMARAEQNKYYRKELLDDIVVRMRPFVTSDSRFEGIEQLVLIASTSASLGFLSVRLFDPNRVLVVHDGQHARDTAELIDGLAITGRPTNMPRYVEPAQCRPDNNFAADVKAALRRCSVNGGGRILLDLTAGYRHYVFAILSALPENAVVTCIHAEMDGRYSSVKPGTERLSVLDIPGR